VDRASGALPARGTLEIFFGFQRAGMAGREGEMNEIKFDGSEVPFAWIVHAARLRGRVLACRDASDQNAALFLLRRFEHPIRLNRSGSGQVDEKFARQLRINVIVEGTGDGQIVVRASPRNLRAIAATIRDRVEWQQFLESSRQTG
jgi:hypothetical protein